MDTLRVIVVFALLLVGIALIGYFTLGGKE